MHVSMPPETPPPDDERRPPASTSSEGGNVVDPAVLAERRAQRAEQAERSAARRAADAQVLAAQLARERTRLEAERDAARAEAAAAREGADAAIAEARHLQGERDTLREALIQARRERDALAERAAAPAGEPDARAEQPAVAPPRPVAPAEPEAPLTEQPALAEQPAVPTESVAEPAGAAASVPFSEPAPNTPPAAANGTSRNGHAAPPAAWAAGLRRELAVARTAAAISAPAAPRPPAAPVPGLARERRVVAQRAAAGPIAATKPVPDAEGQRRGDRAAPITALALERERSSRLQAQLDSSLAVQRELRTHIAALQRAVHQRVEAERRIEAALRRVREELTAANALAAGRPLPAPAAPPPATTEPPAGASTAPAPSSAVPAPPTAPPRAGAGSAALSALPMPPAPATPTPAGEPAMSAPVAEPPAGEPATSAPVAGPPAAEPATSAPVAGSPAAESSSPPPLAEPGASASLAPAPLDPQRLTAARERLRAAMPPADHAEQPVALEAGPPAPWATAALQHLLATEPETAGRIAVGLLPAQGLAATRPLRYDLLLAGRGCLAVDVVPGAPATVTQRPAPRPRSERDLSVAGNAIGVARLLHGRRTLLRRPARVRGGRKALRELRRLARAPLSLRELGGAGVALDPALALRLVALAIDPAATHGERFAIAHAPLAGGPVDAWLRIADGAEPAVVTQAPAEPTRLTLRCTRGALLALIAGVAPPPGEAGTINGDRAALALLRAWIAPTEHPAA